MSKTKKLTSAAKKNINATKKTGVQMFNVLGRQEIAYQRLSVIGVIIFVGFLLLILWLISANNNMANQLKAAKENQIIYAFPTASGVFISSDVIPDDHIIAMVRDFTNNRHNFNTYSVSDNIDYSKRMMTPEYLEASKSALANTKRLTIRQDISQTFIPIGAIKIAKKADGFIVTFNARRTRYAGGSEYANDVLKVTYEVDKVLPSKYYYWALMISNTTLEKA
jgi:hypothetical protein